MKVRLTVKGDLVKHVHILPFEKLPDVLVWGSRLFQLKSSDVLPVYEECFAYFITGLEEEACAPVND